MLATIGPIAERQQIPTFSTESEPSATKGKKYVLRFANNGTDYAQALLSELRKRNFKTFGVIKVENQYHNTLWEAFSQSLENDERADLLYNFQPGDQDFRAAISKLRSRKFDAIGLYLTPGMQASFLKQLKNSGTRFPLFGTASFESHEAHRGLEDVVEGSLYANNAVSMDFIDRYQKRFGNVVQNAHAALAYECT